MDSVIRPSSPHRLLRSCGGSVPYARTRRPGPAASPQTWFPPPHAMRQPRSGRRRPGRSRRPAQSRFDPDISAAVPGTQLRGAAEIARRLEAMGVKVTPQAIGNLISGRAAKAHRKLRSALIRLARDCAQTELESQGFSHGTFVLESDFLVLVMWHNRKMSKDQPS